MTADFKVCPKCGQRLVLTMVRCGRCHHYMPPPPGMGPIIHERSQMKGIIAVLAILLVISGITFLARWSPAPPFVGKWESSDNTMRLSLGSDNTGHVSTALAEIPLRWHASPGVLQFEPVGHSSDCILFKPSMMGITMPSNPVVNEQLGIHPFTGMIPWPWRITDDRQVMTFIGGTVIEWRRL